MYRVLVVDDEKLVRRGIISILPWTECGLAVAGEAQNGKKALEVLQETRIDLVFTDIVMPGMDGLALLEELAHRYPEVASVVLTCHQEFPYIQKALRFGVLDFIVKTQLEQDSLDELLTGIVSRFEARRHGFHVGRVRDAGSQSVGHTREAQEGRRSYSRGIVQRIEEAAELAAGNVTTVSQDRLAEQANMSRSYFSQCFKDIMGVPFSEFMRDRRMALARELLITTVLPVYAVAQSVGFQDEKYFSRLFRQREGVLPSQFREESRA